jgi:hypothetical protein
MNDPLPSAPADNGEVHYRFNLTGLDEGLRKDLEANAHLARRTPAQRLADIINRKLAHVGIKLEAA